MFLSFRLCFLLWLVTVPLSAASTKNDIAISFSLEQITAMALKASDKITAQKARVEEKRHAALAKATFPNPSFDIDSSFALSHLENGPLLNLKLNQELPFFGKRKLRREISDFDVKHEELRLKEYEVAITAEVTRIAFEYVINQRKAQYAESRRKRFELIRAFLLGHTFASPQQKTSSLIVRERLKHIATEKERLAALSQTKLLDLQFYVPEQFVGAHFQVPWLSGEKTLDESALKTMIVDNNPELGILRAQVLQIEKERALLSKEVWPDITVSLYYGQDSFVDPAHSLGVGFNIPLPLWSRNKAAIHSKDQAMVAHTADLSSKQKMADLRLAKLLVDYRSLQKIVANYSEREIANLESELRAMEGEFRKNRIDFPLFLELDIEAADMVDRILDAQIALMNSIIALAELANDRFLLTQLASF